MAATGRVLGFCGFRRTVSDLQRSIDFYVQALGFSMDVPASAGVARLSLGSESIELFAPAHPYARDAANLAVASSAFQHIAIVTNDMTAAMRQLARHAPMPISTDGAAVQLPARSGGVIAFKFRDPDGHALELISFPQGTGDAKWQHLAAHGGPTLGIDHSAIGVMSVERSVAFYVGLLGLRESARQLNHGNEQARLDGVEAPEVEVVSLLPDAAETPHVELLCYRAPVPQRRASVPPLSQDLADRMTFRVDDLAAIMARLGSAQVECQTLGSDAALIRHEQSHPILLILLPGILGCVAIAVTWPAAAAGGSGTGSGTGTDGLQLAYQPTGLDWSAEEVEHATADNFDSILQRAQRDRTLGCHHHCEQFRQIFDRLVLRARQQTDRARALPWSLTILRSPDVQAMALPGGQVLLSETFVRSRRLSDEALAFVLAHEMAHSILEHERQTLHFARLLLPRGVNRNVADIYTEIDYNFALLKSLEPVMQQEELEADELGLLLASAAGFDPKRQLTFIEGEARLPEEVEPLVRTHPTALLRLERLRVRLPLAERLYIASHDLGSHRTESR